MRKPCSAWLGVTVDVKWKHELVGSVGCKMFVSSVMSGPHLGKLAFKVPDDHFLALTERAGIIPVPYSARYKWIAITAPNNMDITWLARMIRQSFDLVAAKLPKKKQRELGLA